MVFLDVIILDYVELALDEGVVCVGGEKASAWISLKE